MGQLEKLLCSFILITALIATIVSSSALVDDRCRDDSFCKTYCLSTNPEETESARCGKDHKSCICITPSKRAIKVRFIEERNPVPSTTTPPPSTSYPGVQYVNSQSVQKPPYGQNGGQYGNGNSIAGSSSQQQQQKPDPATPVLLECDGSERATRTCHSFCTVEIRAWYGLCNITSKACACFGIPLSAVQQASVNSPIYDFSEPIAAIFHSSAPATPAPSTTTPRPTYPPARPAGHQQYPLYQYPQHQQPHPQNPQRPLPPHIPQSPVPPQQQQPQPGQLTPPQHDNHPWKPIPPSYQPLYNYYQQPNNGQMPTLLNPVPQGNQLQDQGPVRSVANLFGPNGQPVPTSFSTPDASADVTVTSTGHGSSSILSESVPEKLESDSLKPAEEIEETSSTTSTQAPHSRRRRSINDTPIVKGKDSASKKEKIFESEGTNRTCSRYKCAISCKKNNYAAPDCQPKCIDDECWCECFPRL